MHIQVYGKQSDIQAVKPILLEQFSGEIRFSFFNAESILIPTVVQKGSFFIVLYRKEFLHKGWFFYLMGYLANTGNHAFLYTVPSETASIPDWISDGLEAVVNPKILRMKIISAYNNWLLERERDQAQKTLRLEGYHVILPELCECIEEGNLPHTETFLQAGFSPSSVDRKGVPLVCVSARSGHGRILDLLIEKGADVHAVSSDRGNTVLMDAVSAGSENMVSNLLREGVDPDVISKNGQTALILASGQGREEICRMLVEGGASLDIEDSMGMTAYGYAELFGSEELRTLLQIEKSEN